MPSIWRRERQLVFIHPYNDLAVMAGQGTLALELLEDAPELDALVIPVGGGGLLAGCLVAATTLRPGIAVYRRGGRSLRRHGAELAGRTVSVGGPTIAEGIAVRDIGELPFELVRRRVTDMLVVPERAVEEAIGLLAEGGKTVAEGAGAVGVAALLAFASRFRGKRVGVAITGGNIDARILSNVLLRNLLRDGRLLRLHLQIPDRPGVLADIAGKIGDERRQHHRSIAPALVRRRVGAGGGAGGYGGGARSRPRSGDHGGAGAKLRGAASVAPSGSSSWNRR